MTDTKTPTRSRLPHHRLVAYTVATELLLAVRAADIRDPKLRRAGQPSRQGASSRSLLTGLIR